MTLQSADALKDRLADVLAELDDDLIRDTQRLIGFQTVSGGNEEQERRYLEEIPACFAWLEELAKRNGFTFRSWGGEVAEIEWSIPPEPGNGRRCVAGIASHVDVVTPAGKWSHPPFDAAIDDGILYGRGIQDDKGPLMQVLYGMIAAKRAGVRPSCDVRVIIGTREETGEWSDIRRYLEERAAPDFGFTPDADFPLIIGEKGMTNLRFSARWQPVSPHPETGMMFVSLKGGERSNIVPALSEVLLRFPATAKHEVMKELVRETTRYTVENPSANITMVPSNEKELEPAGVYETLISFVGRAAHSSTPEAGYNAVVDALRFFSDIETIPPAVRAFVQFLALVSADNAGTHLGIASEHPFVGTTTAVISLLEIDAEGGTANLNVRPTMGMSCETVLEKARDTARAFAEETGLDIAVEPNGKRLDASYLDPDEPIIGGFLDSLGQAFQAVTGEEPQRIAIGGTTYAKALPNCCAFGPVLRGVDREMAHQADEQMALDSIRRNALIYGLSIALMR